MCDKAEAEEAVNEWVDGEKDGAMDPDGEASWGVWFNMIVIREIDLLFSVVFCPLFIAHCVVSVHHNAN